MREGQNDLYVSAVQERGAIKYSLTILNNDMGHSSCCIAIAAKAMDFFSKEN